MQKPEIHGGGINSTRTNRQRFFEEIKRSLLSESPPTAVVDKVIPDPENRDFLKLFGRGFTPASEVYIDGRYCCSEFFHAGELRVTLPETVRSGASLSVTNVPLITLQEKLLTAQAESLAISNLRVIPETPLRTKQPFALALDFQWGDSTPVRVLELRLIFPDREIRTQTYPISEKESCGGQKILENFKVGRGGILEVHAALYDEAGNADYLERLFPVVPSNPLQLYVYPQHYSQTTWKGAAEYRSSDNRYYAEGRWVISNGNSYSVTVGPRVRCRVSDAGLGELADFNFNISTTTIPANSSRTIYVYTWHGSGSDVYDLFRDFGDAKYEFWLQSPEGDLYDWNVWVAMAQVGVTANFVGNFSWAEMLKVRDIIDIYSTGIYNQVDCIFTANTPILEIPNGDPDWNRYRDIHVEEVSCGSACTDSDEADDMRDDWSAPSEYDNYIDIFFVESFSGDPCASSLGGFSPVDGPTSKGGDDSGVVIDVKDLNILSSSTGEQILGIVIAHEVGHYLDLEHTSASNNFMQSTVGVSNTNITYDQWKTMRDHGFVYRLNP